LGQLIGNFAFTPPGPRNDASYEAKKAWPKIWGFTANLDLYPYAHEVIGSHWFCDTRLYDGHNTHVYFNWYNRHTGKLIFTYEFQIPNPSEYGYAYWNSYNGWSWVDHTDAEIAYRMGVDLELVITSNTLGDHKFIRQFEIESSIDPPSQIMCTPGEQKCIGDDLYKCNAAGNDWVLVAENSPSCQYQGPCPNWWDDLPGFVICHILLSIEAALGLVTGGFLTLISNVKNFLDNFSIHIVAFLGDIKGQVEDAIGGAIATVSHVTTAITTYVSDWWDDTLTTINTWMSDTWNNITDFWDDVTTKINDWWTETWLSIENWVMDQWNNFTDFLHDVNDAIENWWTDTVDTINTWMSDQWNNLTDFWDDITTKIGTWWDNTKKAVWDALNDSVAAINDWATSTFLDFVDWVNTLGQDVADFVEDRIDDAKTTLDDTIKTITDGIPDEVNKLFDALLTSNPVVKFLYDMITGTYMDTAEMKEKQQNILDKMQEIKDLINRIE